jgi:hypothetical protein
MLFGLVCSTVANWSMGHPKEPLTHVDFMPSQWAKEEPLTKGEEKKLGALEVNNVFRNMFGFAAKTEAVAEAPGAVIRPKTKWWVNEVPQNV